MVILYNFAPSENTAKGLFSDGICAKSTNNVADEQLEWYNFTVSVRDEGALKVLLRKYI